MLKKPNQKSLPQKCFNESDQCQQNMCFGINIRSLCRKDKITLNEYTRGPNEFVSCITIDGVFSLNSLKYYDNQVFFIKILVVVKCQNSKILECMTSIAVKANIFNIA